MVTCAMCLINKEIEKSIWEENNPENTRAEREVRESETRLVEFGGHLTLQTIMWWRSCISSTMCVEPSGEL